MATIDSHIDKSNKQDVHGYDYMIIKKVTIGIKKGGLLGAAMFCTLIIILAQQNILLLNDSLAISLTTSALIGFIWGGIIGLLISPMISVKKK